LLSVVADTLHDQLSDAHVGLSNNIEDMQRASAALALASEAQEALAAEKQSLAGQVTELQGQLAEVNAQLCDLQEQQQANASQVRKTSAGLHALATLDFSGLKSSGFVRGFLSYSCEV